MSGADRARGGADPGRRPVGRSLLVVDDDPVLREVLRTNLEAEGWTVAEAVDGDEAWLLADLMRPDAVVLDVMLPGRDGLDVLREVRAHAELGRTPVVVLSARASRADVLAAWDAGASQVVTKPFDLEALLASLQAVVPHP